MNIFEVENHEPSLLPEGEWTLAWSDEFDGDELDRSKWDFRLNFWGKPFPAYTDQGVVVRNGCVELHRTERDGCYVSPQLQTGSNSFDIPMGDQGNPWNQDTLWRLGELSPAKFEHRFGMLWTETEYVFYCDGKEVGRCNAAVSQVPQFILLTTEVRGYRNKTPLKVGEYSTDYSAIGVGSIARRQEGFTDDAFIVDYVRVYDKVN